MGDVPTVNTSTWRLPKKGHQTPEASYTDDMYRAKGLPVDPDRAPTTGASGLPTVSTEDWVTPSTRARLEEEQGSLGDQELSERKPRGVGRRSGSPSTWSKSERKGKGRGPSSPGGSAKRWERRGAKKEIEAQQRGEDVDDFEPIEDEVVEMGCSSGKKGKKSYLSKKKRPMKEAPQVESVQSVQRRLAGLEESRHLEFATGTPYRRMPSSMLQETGLDPIGEAQVELGETEFDLPHGQRELAGLTERAPLPHPMHDTRPVSARRAHGILDDGKDGGEEFVDQVLEESRWFFRDFGDLALGAKKRPFDEAPGGRSGPWRGSEDEPAETPVVRHGKVKGMVGDDQEPEPEDDGKKQVPPAKKSKAKAPPPKEPEEDEDEGEEQTEAEGHSYLKRSGSRLKAVGHRLSHGSAAQRAKAGLHHHLQKFAKKHGIDIHKHFHPHDKPEKMKAPGKKAKTKAPKHIAPTVGPTLKKK